MTADVNTIAVPSPVISRVAEVKLINLDKPNQNTRAFANVRIGPFILRGFSVIRKREDGKKDNIFVMPPARYDREKKKNYPYISVDEDFQRHLYEKILMAYNAELQAYRKKSLEERAMPQPSAPDPEGYPAGFAETFDHDFPF